MVRPIMRDMLFLSQQAEPATKDDISVGRDLLDTLKAHEHECVGMAANMIGVNKAIIVVSMGFANVVMYNPVIIKATGAYETEEGCLSLAGVRKTTRYKDIVVEYENERFEKQKQNFSGFIAQIIEHECDHLKANYII